MSKMTTRVNPLHSRVRIRATRCRWNDRNREGPIYGNDDKANRRQATHFQVGSEHEHGTCHPARARAQDQVTSTPLHARCLTLPQGLIRPPQSTRVSGIYKASLLSQDGPLPRFGPFAAVTATHSTIVHPQLRVAFFTPPPQ